MSIRIMNEVWGRSDLDPYERLVMLSLADHANDEGICYPSVARLCERTGMKERGVQTVVKRLASKGFITVEMQAGRKGANLYTIRSTPAPDAPPHDMHPAPDAPAPDAPPPHPITKTPAPDAPAPDAPPPHPITKTPAPDAPEPSGTIIGSGGSAREQPIDPTSMASVRERILEAIGVDPVSGIIGPNARQIGTEIDMAIARRWSVELGLTVEQQLTVIRETMAGKRDGPPNSFKFFDKPMARFAGELRRLAAEPLSPTDTPSRTKGHSHDRNGTFDQRHDEYLRRLAAGEIDRGPDPSDPWAR